MPARCVVCDHKSRAEIEAEAREASSLGALVDVCAKFDVQRTKLERHMGRCLAVAGPCRARRRGKPSSDDAAPDSGPRTASELREPPPAAEEAGSELPPLRELGSPAEELRYQAKLLTRQLERTDLSPTQLAQVSNALRALYRHVERARDESPIHEHPAFLGLVEDLVEAVVGELGPGAPEGIEGRIAERFEQLQAERAAGPGPSLRRVA